MKRLVKQTDWRRAFGLVAALAIAAPLAAQNIVLRYAGPNPGKYRQGSVVSPAAELAAGESLTVLTPQGTRELKGPLRVSQAAPRARAEPSLLDGLSSGRRQRIGAVRAGPRAATAASLPSLWAIDAERGGTFCLLKGTSPSLWRPAAAAAERLAIGETSATLQWSADNMAAWPAGLPLVYGESYKLVGSGEARTLTLRELAAAGDTTAMLEAALSANGCEQQAAFVRSSAFAAEDQPE